MIYGPSYEGATRECEACGHFTNVHHDCDHCTKPICENCAHTNRNGRYCSPECEQASCAHDHLHYEIFDDVCEDAGYVSYYETWTCKDCGVAFDESELAETERRAA